jgi:hypothetical protein
LAGVVIVAGFVGTRYWQPRSSLAYFVIQLAGFVTVTGLLPAGGVVPYRPGVVGSERLRLFVSGLEIIWWLGAAWLTVGFCVHLSKSLSKRRLPSVHIEGAHDPKVACSQQRRLQLRLRSKLTPSIDLISHPARFEEKKLRMRYLTHR